MFKRFRHIRFKLMETQKTAKYLKYAIGEIILVVIGILIAVAINGKYTDAQNEKKVRAILTQVQHELLTDIADAKRIFGVYIHKDSLGQRILHDSVTVNTPVNQLNITNNYVSFSNKKGGYQRLMQNLENLPERYHSLLPDFNYLYVEMQNDIDDYNAIIKNTVMRVNREQEMTNPKLTDYILGKYPEEGAHYWIHASNLKNKVFYYLNDLRNISEAANDYRIESIGLYKKIDALLGVTPQNYPEALRIVPDNALIEPYLGEYTWVRGTMTANNASFELKDKQFIRRTPRGMVPLYWDGALTFFQKGSDAIYRFYKNAKQQHCLAFSDGLKSMVLIKNTDL